MAALATRAERAAPQDYSVLALPLTGELAAQCAAWGDAVVDGPQEGELLGDGEHLVGAGSEFARPLRAVVDGQPVRWNERVQLVRAVTLAKRRQTTLDKQLAAAAAELWALTPAPGRGKRPLREEATLAAAIASVLARHAVTGLLTVQWERQQTTVTHYVGRGRGGPERPTRPEVHVRYVLTAVQRNEAAIAACQHRLGGRV